jgi:hypothetical protein
MRGLAYLLKAKGGRRGERTEGRKEGRKERKIYFLPALYFFSFQLFVSCQMLAV